MTSHDVRDMLDLPGTAAPRPTKKAKTTAHKPKLTGLSREVQNLGGDNPIAIVPEDTVFKKKRWGSRKPAARWERRVFGNSERGDEGFLLKHWRKVEAKVEGSGGEGEGEGEGDGKKVEEKVENSPFAVYNVKIPFPTYNDEEYKERLEDGEWTRDETDYLMEMVKEYDLRWSVIWDRYEYKPSPNAKSDEYIDQTPKVRTMEDLKARYYFVAADIMELRKPKHQMNNAEFDLHQKMLAFNPQQEKTRKSFVEGTLARTKEEATEEASLMVELRRILARSEKINEERRELYARLDTPPTMGNITAFNNSAGLGNLLQQLMTADKSKKRKALTEGQTPVSGTPGAQTPGGFNDRRDSSIRDSVSGPSGSNGSATTNNKKGSISNPNNPTERRKLSEEEEKIYGVTHHDRLQGGPYFRGDKLARPLTMKSSVQQTRIKNTLMELGIPEKAMMATTEVAMGYEALFASIATFLDARKVVDKLSNEIAVAKEAVEEKKRRKREREREKLERAQVDGAGDVEGEAADGNGVVGDRNGNEDEGENAQIKEEEKEKAKGQDKDQKQLDPESKEQDIENGKSNGDTNDSSEGTNANGVASAAGSNHKRSASVLSTGSDKSSKRVKK